MRKFQVTQSLVAGTATVEADDFTISVTQEDAFCVTHARFWQYKALVAAGAAGQVEQVLAHYFRNPIAITDLARCRRGAA